LGFGIYERLVKSCARGPLNDRRNGIQQKRQASDLIYSGPRSLETLTPRADEKWINAQWRGNFLTQIRNLIESLKLLSPRIEDEDEDESKR